MSRRIIHGDALERLRELDTNSAHGMVTDPPSGIGFMGKQWDKNKGGRDAWVAWLGAIFAEARRVLVPGAHVPVELMRWLARLVTPPDGVVLDPFTGSGTTACACALEGFGFIGVEQDESYVEIARARVAHFERLAVMPSPDVTMRGEGGQMGLFEGGA